ncbi:MAG: type II toxin-antitoxin system VapC family toxin [Hymenobacter sp.]|nr:MAG: type II toxin-antitoxin system VapC family toxin [Hymenobacter sp.]
MRLLLDTHAFLWFYSGDERLSFTGKALIDDPANECFLSIASIWEMGIKTSIGKLELRVDFAGLAEFMAANRIELLPISFEHIQRLQYLPFHHRDPFDRLLIAQAFSEGLTLLSRDTLFPQYGVAIQW